MNLRARRAGEALIIELDGQLDFESTQQFQDTCEDLIRKADTKQVVFHLRGLRFVGSSGINHFIRVLKEFNSFAEKPRLCHLSTEFMRMFRAYQSVRNPFEILEDEALAIASFAESRPGKPMAKTKSRKRPRLTGPRRRGSA